MSLSRTTRLPDLQAELRAKFIAASKARRRAVRELLAAGVPEEEHARFLPAVDWSQFVDLRCGAKAESTGRPCQIKALHGCGRCKLHGGASTGPKTAAGKAKSAANGRSSGDRPIDRLQTVERDPTPRMWP